MERKLNFLDYLRVDMRRAICSWKFLMGVAGVSMVMYIASLEGIASDTSVVYVVWLIVYGMLFMLSLVFSVFPFVCCFCEDFEQKYGYLQIERGNLRSYTCSKVLTIMLVSVCTMMLGMLLYVSFLHLQLPWFREDEAICQSALTVGGFRWILKKKWYFLYFACFGLQYGILAGILALLAAFVSLFVNNKLLTLSVPFIGFYFISYYSRALFGNVEKINLIYIFNATYNIWNHDIYSFGYAVLVGVIFSVIFERLIHMKLKRKMNYE